MTAGELFATGACEFVVLAGLRNALVGKKLNRMGVHSFALSSSRQLGKGARGRILVGGLRRGKETSGGAAANVHGFAEVHRKSY